MRRAVILGVAAAVCMAAGAVAFSAAEHVPFWLAGYWAIETGTTVGYGDVTPRGTAGRVIAVVLMLCAIPLLGASFATLTAEHVHKRHLESEGRRKADLEEMEGRIKDHMEARLRHHLGVE